MDLRIVKTRRNIREAFIQLRADTPLEKIRVTELCKLAMINKTTFYKHYENIYALSDEIEDESIQAIMDSFAHMDALFSEPERFVKGMYYAFKSHEALIQTLFFGRLNVLIDKIEAQLETHYLLNESPQKDITISFLFLGAAQVLTSSRYDETILLDTVAEITKQVIVQMAL